MRACVHRSRRSSPACARPTSRTNDETPGLRLQLDFFRKLRLFQ
jgi:hypothetical protein